MESWRRRRVEIKTMTVPNRHLDLINGHLITEPQRRPLRSGDNCRNPRIAAGEIQIVMGEVTGSLWATLRPPTP